MGGLTLNEEQAVRESERHGLVLLLTGGMGDGSMVFGMGKREQRW